LYFGVFSRTSPTCCHKAGATYVSLHSGRLDDISTDGNGHRRNQADLLIIMDTETQILAASVRHRHAYILNCAKNCFMSTGPLSAIEGLLNIRFTDSGLATFLADYG
jgi:transaldolase